MVNSINFLEELYQINIYTPCKLYVYKVFPFIKMLCNLLKIIIITDSYGIWFTKIESHLLNGLSIYKRKSRVAINPLLYIKYKIFNDLH
jgi:hypothetical protein